MNNSPHHIYSVSLSISGVNLRPTEISDELGILPIRVSLGDENARIPKDRKPYWEYDGYDIVGYKEDWDNLNSALNFLIEALESRRCQIIKYSKSFSVIWKVGHFQSTFDGGPTILPSVLSDLSRFELPLFIDNYFSDLPM